MTLHTLTVAKANEDTFIALRDVNNYDGGMQHRAYLDAVEALDDDPAGFKTIVVTGGFVRGFRRFCQKLVGVFPYTVDALQLTDCEIAVVKW